MIFKEKGNKEKPTIILLHGGGLSWWSLDPITESLLENFHVVTPIIDGHGEDFSTPFVSIQDSSQKLIDYIDTYHNETVYAIAGLSIGAQILVQTLSIRNDIAQFAIIESALVYPMRVTTALTIPIFKLCFGLLQKEWFAKMQAKTLCIPPNLFNRYYEDSKKMSKESLIHMSMSNGNFSLSNRIQQTKAKVLIIVGEKELGIMKKSAQRIHDSIEGSRIFIAKRMSHGELSLKNSDVYISLLKNFFNT